MAAQAISGPLEPAWFEERLGAAYHDDLWSILCSNNPTLCAALAAPSFTPAHLTCSHVQTMKAIFPPKYSSDLDQHLLLPRRSLLDATRHLTASLIRFSPVGCVRCYGSSEPNDWITPLTPVKGRALLEPQPRWKDLRRPGLSCSLHGRKILNGQITQDIGFPTNPNGSPNPNYDVSKPIHGKKSLPVFVLEQGTLIPPGVEIEQDDDDHATIALTDQSLVFFVPNEKKTGGKWEVVSFNRPNLLWQETRAMMQTSAERWPDWFSSDDSGGNILVAALDCLQERETEDHDNDQNLFFEVDDLLARALLAQTTAERAAVILDAEALVASHQEGNK